VPGGQVLLPGALAERCHDDDDNDDDDNPVWQTWAVGALFSGARRIPSNRACSHITPTSLRSRDILVMDELQSTNLQSRRSITSDHYIVP
jgi:hypothetical protein